MNRPASVERVNHLVDLLLQGNHGESVLAELESLLVQDDAALAAYLDRCALETSLRFEVRSAAVARRIDEAIATQPHHALRRPDPGRPRTFPWGLPLAATLGAVSIAALWLAGHSATIHAERQPRPVARLESADKASWLGDNYPVGRRFFEGDSIYLTKGSARISMASGVEVALVAPCFVSLEDDMLVRLEEGQLTAQVAEWAHGFSVSTDAMRIEDLGTKFAVATDSRGGVETHVLTGQVRIHPKARPIDSRQSVLLGEGEALRLQKSAKVATKLEADRARFDADLDDVAPYKPIELHNTGRGLDEGDEDPHWRVVAGPNCPQFPGPLFAVVCNADGRYLSNDRDHSQWVSLVNPVRPGLPPNTTFTFQTRFDLTGYDLSSVVLSAQVIADNGVKAVRVNGAPAPIESWELNDPDQVFNRFHVIEVAEGFVGGSNLIEFDVWNGVDRAEPQGANPLALRVEWQAYGRMKPSPTAKAAARFETKAHSAPKG